VNETDAELVSRCLAGERAAFEAVYAAHAGRAGAYFRRCGFAAADADDLVQDTFVRAFKSLGTFDASRGTFAGWLATIARNVARKRWRRRREPECFDPELADEMFAAEDNPGGSPEVREQLAALRECIGRLPSKLGLIVHLRYVDGRTTRGIAAALGMPEATVRLRLGEAVAALQREMGARGIRG